MSVPSLPSSVVGSPLSTVGVDLGVWKYNLDREPSYRSPRGAPKNKTVTFYTWDFGGQVRCETNASHTVGQAAYVVLSAAVWSRMATLVH